MVFDEKGEDALQLFDNFQFELLLLDRTLPGISGLDVCKLYRKSDGLANIIFLTSRGDIAQKEALLSSMRNLRAKIGAITSDTVIQTISKSGYLSEQSS